MKTFLIIHNIPDIECVAPNQYRLSSAGTHAEVKAADRVVVCDSGAIAAFEDASGRLLWAFARGTWSYLEERAEKT